MKDKGTYLVPTLVTYWALKEQGVAAGMKPEMVEKMGSCVEKGFEALSVARSAGLDICFGSDLLGSLHTHQSKEFELRSRVLPAREVLLSATSTCASLFGQSASIGRVQPGFDADLCILDKGVDPSGDASVLAKGEEAVWMVLKKGKIVASRDAVHAQLVHFN
jgi:imidazolonepropionase-like amidohydrolase